jgi:hypothetical protein
VLCPASFFILIESAFCAVFLTVERCNLVSEKIFQTKKLKIILLTNLLWVHGTSDFFANFPLRSWAFQWCRSTFVFLTLRLFFVHIFPRKSLSLFVCISPHINVSIISSTLYYTIVACYFRWNRHFALFCDRCKNSIFFNWTQLDLELRLVKSEQWIESRLKFCLVGWRSSIRVKYSKGDKKIVLEYYYRRRLLLYDTVVTQRAYTALFYQVRSTHYDCVE